jgi:hypothetical protein
LLAEEFGQEALDRDIGRLSEVAASPSLSVDPRQRAPAFAPDRAAEDASHAAARKTRSLCAATAEVASSGGSTRDQQPAPIFLKKEFGQEVLDRDVGSLLAVFRAGQDCHAFLATLPTFASVSSLAGFVTELNTAIHMLCMDRVNSAAALQVRPCFANTMVYPLLVLLNATSISQGIPLIFFVGVVHTFINSVLNKTAFVRMGKWKSRSRHWWVGTANVGKGKSPGMKTFVNVMIEVLSRNASKAAGFAGDRFQFQQSGTTANALDKLRASQAYLTIYCPDATRVLCPAVATGGTTGPYKYVDLDVFLDAAHGDEVSLTTQRLRNKVAKQKVSNPQAPVMPQQGIHMDPTNVHIMLLQQEVIFANWWCQMIPKKNNWHRTALRVLFRGRLGPGTHGPPCFHGRSHGPHHQDLVRIRRAARGAGYGTDRGAALRLHGSAERHRR